MRWVVRIVFGLVSLVLLAVAVLFLLPAERIARIATDRFEAATGRVMTLAGDVRPTLWPELGITTGAVTVANASWSGAGPMLRADALSIGVDMAALLGGTIRIKRVEVDAPEIVLEIDKNGRGNWETAAAGSAAAASGGSGGIPAFTLDRAAFNDAAISFRDHRSGTRTEVGGVDAVVRVPDFAAAATVALTARVNGQPVALQANIGEFAAFVAQRVVPVAVTLDLGGASMAIDGRAGLQPLAAGGRVTADLGDMAAFFAFLGQSAPALPKGLGQSVGLDGDFTYTDTGAVTLRDATIRLDGNRLTGAVDVALGARVRITAQLAAGALDLTGLAGGGGDGDAAASGGWPQDRIDLSGMQAVDAEIVLNAESIDFGRAQLGRTRLTTRLDTGRAVTEIREMAAYGGSVAGTVVVNSRGGLSARADLTAAGVALQPLLRQLAGYDRLQAAGDLRINLLGSGNSIAALMNSLSGDGSIQLGAGELAGFDLVGMLRRLDASYVGTGAKTIFRSVSATFLVENGVLRNDDLRFDSPLLSAGGRGRVGLGPQTLDYRIIPTVLQGKTEDAGVKVPVLISGPWASPKFRLDLEGLAQERLDAEAAKLKLAAEQAVKQKLTEELGVTVPDGQKIEDAVKQELQDRATKGLIDFLGGKN